MNFSNKKAKLEIAYTAICVLALTVLFIFDTFLAGYLLGASAASFTEPFFFILAAVFLVVGIKIDVVFAASLVAASYTLISFSHVNGFLKEIGQNPNGIEVASGLAVRSFAAALTLYLIIVLINNVLSKPAKIEQSDVDRRKQPKIANRKLRLSAFGVFGWVVSVGIVVLLFEPYGGRMRDDDFFHMLLVMFVPSFAAIVLYWIYERFVR